MFLVGVGAVVVIILLLVLIEPVQEEPDKKSECVDSEFSDWWPE